MSYAKYEAKPASIEPNRLSRLAVAAFLCSLSAGVDAVDLGDPYIPDPAGAITGSDTAGNVWIGVNSANSTLSIQAGGALNLDAGKSFYVGVDLSGNSASVVGASNVSQANLSVPNDIYVGLNDSSDNNSMTVGDWGNITAGRLVMGMNDNSSSNTFTASGANGTLQFSGDVYVGYFGDSNQVVIDQGRDVTVGGHVYLGVEAPSSGNTLTVSGSGSSLVSAQEMIIGFGGSNNTLQVLNGGQVTNRHTYIGFFSGADGNGATVSGTGALWRTNGVFYFGFASDNNQVTVNTGGQIVVGTGSGAQDAFTVTPDGALRISAGRLATINGNYLQQTGGTFHLDANSASTFGQLVVTGNAALQNGARIVVTISNCASIPVGSTLHSVISATQSLSRYGIAVDDNCADVGFVAVQSGNTINLQAMPVTHTAVPTLGEWSMAILSGILGLAGLFARRARNSV